MNKWTEEEKKILVEYFNKGYKATAIGRILGRTRFSVQKKMERMEMDPEYYYDYVEVQDR